MPDPTERLNAALEGRYSIEREPGEGGMKHWWRLWVGAPNGSPQVNFLDTSALRPGVSPS